MNLRREFVEGDWEINGIEGFGYALRVACVV